MTGCCAKNCHNRAEQGFRLFKFPSDELRKEIWSRQCGKRPKEHSRLCEYHFDDSQFENARQDGWRKLKPNAIPTIFCKEEKIVIEGNIKKESEPPPLLSFQETLVDETIIDYNHYQFSLLTVNKTTQTEENTDGAVKTTYYSNENGTIRQANEIKYLRKENNLLKARLEKEKSLRTKYQKYIPAFRNLKNKYVTQSKKLEELQRPTRQHITTIVIPTTLTKYQPTLPNKPNSDSKWTLDHCYAKKIRYEFFYE
ncbi:uncharacterized protein [Chelonus insularis]|uniref:uncharacterized protein isoform X2 n=1 Tax=Chelonus insularis TaxID=460826 RepID=UPI00158B414C|nr:uncharacterized protein LOC118068605 isoform X2 [Chelonus insularis]